MQSHARRRPVPSAALRGLVLSPRAKLRHKLRATRLASALILAGLGIFATHPALAVEDALPPAPPLPGSPSADPALVANGTAESAAGNFSSFSALNGGVINTIAPVNIMAGGTAVSATTGGTVNPFNPTTITGVTGISLNNGFLTATAPVTITSTGTSITMTNASVASMIGGGTLTSPALVLNTSGAGTQFTGQNLNFVSQGAAQQFAISVNSGSSVSLTGGSVTATGGQGANTINVDGAGSFLSLKDLSVTTKADTTTPAAVSARNFSTAVLDNLTIVTFPGASEGVAAQTGATITVSNSSITTNGNANALGEAGSGSVGARAFGTSGATPSTVNLFNTNIVTNGTLASGVESDNGGVINMTGGSIVTNNTAAEGVLATATNAAGAVPVGMVSLSGVTVTSTGDAIASSGGTNIVNLTGSTVNLPGSGLALNVRQNAGIGIAANTTVLIDSSTITGAMVTDAVSTSHVTLSNGTMWTMTGNSNLTDLLNDASTITFTPPVGDPTQLASYKTLTVTNYTGAGGTIGLNTLLGKDGSPSDRLVINGGTATGSTALKITNTVGKGDLTVANGILVVDDVKGQSTAPGAFKLAGPVIAGPFEYLLFRGSKDASAPESWFLRSTIDCSAPGAPAAFCPTPAPPPPCPLPTPVGPTPPEVPHLRREVPVFAAVPGLTLLYGRTLLDGLHQRVGDQEQLRARTDLSPSPFANGAWGRVLAQSGDRDGGCPVRVGPTYDFDFAAIQAGFDAYRFQHRGGARDHAGFYAALGMGTSDVTHHFDGTPAGRDHLAGYSLGAYWTHYGAWGWYLDGVLQTTFYDVEGQSTRLPAFETDGWGFAASLEGGVPFKMPGGWSIEPQAQLVYQSIDLGDTRDIGAEVRFEDIDSLAGRVGIRFASTWAVPSGLWGLPQPGLATVWFRPSYWHDFSGDPRTLFSSEIGFIPFRSNLPEDWIELNSGITLQVDRTTSLYANASYQIDTDGNGDAWDGKIGLRVNW